MTAGTRRTRPQETPASRGCVRCTAAAVDARRNEEKAPDTTLEKTVPSWSSGSQETSIQSLGDDRCGTVASASMRSSRIAASTVEQPRWSHGGRRPFWCDGAVRSPLPRHPRRATSGSAEDTVHAGIATSVLTTSRGAASGSSLKATVRRNSPSYRPDLRNARGATGGSVGWTWRLGRSGSGGGPRAATAVASRRPAFCGRTILTAATTGRAALR